MNHGEPSLFLSIDIRHFIGLKEWECIDHFMLTIPEASEIWNRYLIIPHITVDRNCRILHICASKYSMPDPG